MIGPELDAELAYRRERIRAHARPFPKVWSWLSRMKKAARRGRTLRTAKPAENPLREVRHSELGASDV